MIEGVDIIIILEVIYIQRIQKQLQAQDVIIIISIFHHKVAPKW